MKRAGYAVIIVGFLAGALLSVLQERNVEWAYFVPAVVVGVVGVILVRLAARRHILAEGKLSMSMQNIEDSLSRIVENMSQLNAEKDSLDPYDVRHLIDEKFSNDLNTFVDARESIGHVHGLLAYGNVMSYFAAGERYLNRVWSASVDGYIDEVRSYLARAEEQFAEALQALRKAKEQRA
ncbi:MAG: hypothetical protein V3U69_02780 [Bacteroidota bacterium]